MKVKMGEYPVVSSFESHEPRLCSKSQSHCCGWSATQPRSIEIRTEPNVRFCRWLGAAGSAWRVHPSLPSNRASGPELPRASLSGECIRQQTRTLPFVGSRCVRTRANSRSSDLSIGFGHCPGSVDLTVNGKFCGSRGERADGVEQPARIQEFTPFIPMEWPLQ